MSLQDEELPVVMNAILDSRFDNVHTCIPATIVKYEGHGSRMATVKPCTRFRLWDDTLIDPVNIYHVPVLHLSTANTSILLPIKKGDKVLLLIAESSIGNWLNSDGDELVDPEDSSRFTLTDAIAIPGLWPKEIVPQFNNVSGDDLAIAHGDSAILLEKNGDVDVAMTTGKCSVENGAQDLKGLIDDIWSEVNGLSGDLSTWATAVVGIPPPVAPVPVTSVDFVPLVTAMTARLLSITAKTAKVSTLLK